MISASKSTRKATSLADVIVIDSDLEDEDVSPEHGSRSVAANVIDCTCSDDEDVLSFDASDCADGLSASLQKSSSNLTGAKRSRALSSDSDDPEFYPVSHRTTKT